MRRAARALDDTASPAVRGRVRVVIESHRGRERAVRRAVRRLGGRIEVAYRRSTQASLPISALAPLARAADVRYVRVPEEVVAAAVPGEGVATVGAPLWQNGGLTGSGVRVAVIDIGFRGLAQRQAEGDLPASVATHDLCGGEFATRDDHGTAVAEVVHEVAPAARLYLICARTAVAIGQAVEYARNQGVDIISHSAGGHFGRGDGRGGPGSYAGLADFARESGVLWVNSAGNEADRHWAGSFSSADGDDLHEFARGVETNAVAVGAGAELCASLRWDDWPASAHDYDLLITDDAGVVVAQSADLQNGTQAPFEHACHTNRASFTEQFGVSIKRTRATATPRFDLFVDGGGPLLYAVPDGSVVEPATSPNVLAVGAACWRDGSLPPYSSRGPTIDGRVKPDVAAPTAVSSGTYGPSTGCSDYSGFDGTSAAAPHVAGAAALVKQARPAWGPRQIQDFLESSAADLGAAGRDNAFGAGRLALPPAVPALPPVPAATSGSAGDETGDAPAGPDIASAQVSTAGAALTFRVNVANRGALNAGESVHILVDTDGSAETGTGGAELDLAAFAPGGFFILYRWNGSAWQIVRFLGDSSFTGGVLTVVANWNELGLGSAFNFRVVSRSGDSPTDVAPDGPMWSYPQATLTVRTIGPGTGTVTSAPAALSCQGTCSASFSTGTNVVLTAVPAPGSEFRGWDGDCQLGDCAVSVDRPRTVTALFGLLEQPSPPEARAPAAPCRVPNVRRKPLAAARSALKRAGCRSGRVKQAFARGVPRGRVVSQRPAAGARVRRGTPVHLVVSRGRR